jgi:type VI protein secretion system component VasK
MLFNLETSPLRYSRSRSPSGYGSYLYTFMPFYSSSSMLKSVGDRCLYFLVSTLQLSPKHLLTSGMAAEMHKLDRHRDVSTESPQRSSSQWKQYRNCIHLCLIISCKEELWFSKHRLYSIYLSSTLYMIHSLFQHLITRFDHLSAKNQQNQALLPLISKALAFCLCLRSDTWCW